MTGIYKITNTINGKCYIGQSIDIKKRWTEHKRSAFKSKSKKEYPLYRDMRKYGVENFNFEILEECGLAMLNEREIHYIEKYDSLNNGYNQVDGGGATTHHAELTDDIVSAIKQDLKTLKSSRDSIGIKMGLPKNIILEIDNGNLYRDEKENYPLRFNAICNKSNANDSKYFCERCGIPIRKKNSRFCVKCGSENQQKVERPEPLVLAKMIKETGFEKTGKYFGVTGNSIKKWCKAYGIPCQKNELIFWYNKEVGINEFQIKPKNKVDGRNPVQQIDINTGEIIATFESAADAARKLNLGNKRGIHINEACKGLLPHAYGAKWRYLAETDGAPVAYVQTGVARPVCQIDRFTGEKIAEFESINAATKTLGVKNGDVCISRVCRGQRNIAYGSKWCYVEDYIPPVPTSTSSAQTSNPIK